MKIKNNKIENTIDIDFKNSIILQSESTSCYVIESEGFDLEDKMLFIMNGSFSNYSSKWDAMYKLAEYLKMNMFILFILKSLKRLEHFKI